ncbi:MAG: CoA-transferase [Promethearchaeati archaeon SRVP18_Atabeyarchaeia-1]
MNQSGEKSSDFTLIEMMASAGSKILEDRKVIVCGTGIPMLAALLAQKTHAPNIVIIFEAGGIGPQPPTLPISVGDSRTFYRAILAGSMDDAMSALQTGYVDYGFLGVGQIDKYGNINATCIGSHDRMKVSFPGSGGANDIGSLVWKTIIVTGQHDKRRFVEKLDFCTTPGYLTGPGAREAAGLPKDTGPYRVITNMAVMGFDKTTKEMALLSTHPGVSAKQVVENTGFRLSVPSKVDVTDPPTWEEVRILREEIDPAGIFVRRPKK